MVGEHGQTVSLLRLLPMQDSGGLGRTQIGSASLTSWPWCFLCCLLSLITCCPWRNREIALNPLQKLYVLPSPHCTKQQGGFYQTVVGRVRGWSQSSPSPLWSWSAIPLLSPCPCRCRCDAEGCSPHTSTPVMPHQPLASQQSWGGACKPPPTPGSCYFCTSSQLNIT